MNRCMFNMPGCFRCDLSIKILFLLFYVNGACLLKTHFDFSGLCVYVGVV